MSKQAITITIYESESEDGYMYDIYNTDLQGAVDTDDGSIDGGLCTGSMADAVGMATAQALELLKNHKAY